MDLPSLNQFFNCSFHERASTAINNSSASQSSADSNTQFHLNQVETISFGVIAAIFGLIAIMFAALQLRQMQYQSPRADEESLAELGRCKISCLLGWS